MRIGWSRKWGKERDQLWCEMYTGTCLQACVCDCAGTWVTERCVPMCTYVWSLHQVASRVWGIIGIDVLWQYCDQLVLVCLGLSRFEHYKARVLENPSVLGKPAWWVSVPLIYRFIFKIQLVKMIQRNVKPEWTGRVAHLFLCLSYRLQLAGRSSSRLAYVLTFRGCMPDDSIFYSQVWRSSNRLNLANK